MVRPLVFYFIRAVQYLIYDNLETSMPNFSRIRAKRSFGVFVVKKVYIWGGNGRDLSLRDN